MPRTDIMQSMRLRHRRQFRNGSLLGPRMGNVTRRSGLAPVGTAMSRRFKRRREGSQSLPEGDQREHYEPGAQDRHVRPTPERGPIHQIAHPVERWGPGGIRVDRSTPHHQRTHSQQEETTSSGLQAVSQGRWQVVRLQQRHRVSLRSSGPRGLWDHLQHVLMKLLKRVALTISLAD